MDLVLDIKIYIASFNYFAWFMMYFMDVEFKRYASSDEGIRCYIKNFIESIGRRTLLPFINNHVEHSINDEPSDSLRFNIFSNGVLYDSYYLYQKWHQMGKLHRENDLPAFQDLEKKMWYYHGDVNRENDFPAIVYTKGDQIWGINNYIHRENDLPAYIYENGKQEWYCEGELHRENDLPAVMHGENKGWYLRGVKHRENDLPAVIRSNGDKKWYYEGEKHRLDNPAVIKGNGDEKWFIHGRRCNKRTNDDDIGYNVCKKQKL